MKAERRQVTAFLPMWWATTRARHSTWQACTALSFMADGCDAVIVQPIFTGFQDMIVPLAMNAGLPVVADFAVFADAGALLTYGANQSALHQSLGRSGSITPRRRLSPAFADDVFQLSRLNTGKGRDLLGPYRARGSSC